MSGSAVGAGLILPVRDGAFVESEGSDDSEQGDDAQKQRRVLMQAIPGCALGSGEGLTTAEATETTLLVRGYLDVAFVFDASVRAVGVDAKYALGTLFLVACPLRGR